MKAITFPKNAASAHPANHLRTVAMMFTALSEKQSENGHPSPFLRLSLPDAENYFWKNKQELRKNINDKYLINKYLIR
jgi:hypothetical protein